MGTNCRSAIGTLVERTTRFVLLVHLPDGHSAPAVRDAMIPTIATLPEQLRRSLACGRGTELARHRDITVATGLDIYFCDPHSPWQRGSNEKHQRAPAPILPEEHGPFGAEPMQSPEELARVAAELNSQPRKTLGGRTPAEAMQVPVSQDPVATTA